MSTTYRGRIADTLLRQKLDAIGAVLIEGPKACGKTTTAAQQAASVLYVDHPLYAEQYRHLAETNILQLLDGQTPRLIDEWQLVPRLWDAIRFEVDQRSEDGQFILTGSAVPFAGNGKINHTGTGRYGWLRMRPMTLWESGESSGSVSLAQLFENPHAVEGVNKLTLEQVAFVVCRGGWPKAVLAKSERSALAQVSEYYESICHSDISRVDNTHRDLGTTKRLMRSYARHQGTQATLGTIIADMLPNEPERISDATAGSYISALRKIFVIEDAPAWNPNLRSRTAIRTSDTRYYVDPSIAVAAGGLGPRDLLNDLSTFGLLFETLCMRDLRVFADVLGGDVFHYRDKNGLECDAVLHLRNGRYGLIEIKIGGDTQINEAARTLTSLSKKIDTEKMSAPSFCMILTAVGHYAYRRTDDILVVPIGCLKD